MQYLVAMSSYSPYSCLLSLLLSFHISAALFLESCPNSKLWNVRGKDLCGARDKYMCLYDTNERKYRELCKDEPEFHRPGNIFVISGNLRYFAGRPCKSNKYQPHKWWTNGSSECQYLKSTCNEEGQVAYDNGTISNDRKCRCDYTNYYTFVKSTRNKCYCDPKKEDCSCYRKRCHEDEVLTPDYDCVNIHAWTGQFNCPEYKSPRTTDTQELPTLCPNIEKGVFGIKQQTTARVATTVIFGCILVFGVLALVLVIMKKSSWEEIKKVENKVLTMKEDITYLRKELECPTKHTEKEKQEVTRYDGFPDHLRYRFKACVDDWNDEDAVFVPTKAEKEVRDLIETNGCVTIVGSFGTGKSFLVRHVALQMQNRGYTVIPCDIPNDMLRTVRHVGKEMKTVFVFDDVCGKYTMNRSMFRFGRMIESLSIPLLYEGYTKILCTCRLDIFNEEAFRSLYLFNMKIIDLNSFEIRDSEQLDIFNKYNTENANNPIEMSQKYNFFPLLYSKNICVSDVLASELFDMYFDSDDGKMKYCSLVLCVIFENTLTEEIFTSTSDKKIQAMIGDLLYQCELNKGTSLKRLKKSLETLDGSYVVKKDKTYSIIPNMFDFLTTIFKKKLEEFFNGNAYNDFISVDIS